MNSVLMAAVGGADLEEAKKLRQQLTEKGIMRSQVLHNMAAS